MNRHSFFTALALLGILAQGLAAQDRRNEQFYFPGTFNWQFLERYPEGGRLFNAFDYGHAVLYEKLLTRPHQLERELEVRQFDYLTTDLLVRPPRFAVAEEVVEPAYAKLAWRAKMMFDWAHLLHRQIYDIYADPRLSRAAQDSLIERVTDYYLSNRRLAFAVVPKSMSLMDDQYYSQTFRRRFPKFNGLIWAYHWLQVGLYEPLISGGTVAERKAGVQAAIARFWSMVEAPPSRFPKMMPMTPVIAPRFTAAHPRAAIIFDNLHMTHDIISDILASDSVPTDRKRAVIYRALDQMQDTTRDVVSRDEWLNMGEMMGGVGAMGGPATGLLLPLSAATTATPPMAGMDHPQAARPDSMATDQAMPPMDHAMSGMQLGIAADTAKATTSQAAMPGMLMSGGVAGPNAGASPAAALGRLQAIRELLARMMKDPVIRRRMVVDTAMRRLVRELGDTASAGVTPGLDSSTPSRSRATLPRQRSPMRHPPATHSNSSAVPLPLMPGKNRP